ELVRMLLRPGRTFLGGGYESGGSVLVLFQPGGPRAEDRVTAYVALCSGKLMHLVTGQLRGLETERLPHEETGDVALVQRNRHLVRIQINQFHLVGRNAILLQELGDKPGPGGA